MAKVKQARRRAYEYDHHYGIALQGKTAGKRSGDGVSRRPTAPGPAKAAKSKRAAKKR
jgi:hypothetical protein